MALPTGEVCALGTFTATADAVAANANNNDFTDYIDTFPSNTGGYWGVQLAGTGAVPTRFWYAPRAEANTGSYFEQRAFGSIISGSNVGHAADATNQTALYTIQRTTVDIAARRFTWNRITLSGSTKYIYIQYRNAAYIDLSEVRVIVRTSDADAGLLCKPVFPSISPCGGRFPTASSRTVTFASLTTSALIYYTTDGTTPIVTAGVPQGTTTLAAGPVGIIPTAAGVTIKAIAYDALASTPSSDVMTSAPFYLKGFKPNEQWFDATNGRSVEAHSGCIVPPARSGDGYYYLFGQMSDMTNNGGNDPAYGVINGYRSLDFYNWFDLGPMTSQASATAGAKLFVRSNVVKQVNQGTNKWVMWVKASTEGQSYSTIAIWTATSLSGPWTQISVENAPFADLDAQYNNCSDFSFFYEDNGDVYLIANSYDTNGVGAGHVFIRKLSDDRLTCTGASKEVTGGNLREAPVLVKNAGNYFVITSETNYYNSASQTMTVRYVVGTGGTTPLNATYPSIATAVTIFASEPAAGNNFNAQPSCAVFIPGFGYVLLMDYWVQNYNYSSNNVWVPLTFPTATTLQASNSTEWFLPGAFGGRDRPDVMVGGRTSSRDYWRSR